MPKYKYELVFLGRPSRGVTEDQMVISLSNILKIDPHRLRRSLGKHVALYRSNNFNEVQLREKAVVKTGASCLILTKHNMLSDNIGERPVDYDNSISDNHVVSSSGQDILPERNSDHVDHDHPSHHAYAKDNTDTVSRKVPSTNPMKRLNISDGSNDKKSNTHQLGIPPKALLNTKTKTVAWVFSLVIVFLFSYITFMMKSNREYLIGNWVFDADLQIQVQLPLLKQIGRIKTAQDEKTYIEKVTKLDLFNDVRVSFGEKDLLMSRENKSSLKWEYRIISEEKNRLIAWFKKNNASSDKVKKWEIKFYKKKMCMTRMRKGDLHEPLCLRKVKDQ